MPIWTPDESPRFISASFVTVRCDRCRGSMKAVSSHEWVCENNDCPEHGKAVVNGAGAVLRTEEG